MKKTTAVIALIFAFLAGSSLTLCVMHAASTPVMPAAAKAEEVQKTLETYFIGELDEDKLCDAVGEAMVYATGDRWSYYISAENYAAYLEQVSNAFVGVGMTVYQQPDGTKQITEVIDGGSALEAGILPGDELIAVDGADCTDLSVTEIRNLVSGQEGTPVSITVRRDGQALTRTMNRRSIEQQVVRYELLGQVGCITIENFDMTCADKTIAAIEALRAQGATSLLFDVRNNPGGLKDELVKVLDYLLPEGVLFRAEDYLGRKQVDRSDSACVELPMAVLINQDSYSAAEFFAAALSEYGAAVTVGTQTCGKGYFQVAKRLSDGSALNISIGKYYTPNGVSLADAGGLTPDEVVELSQDDAAQLAIHQLKPDDDEQLQKALEQLAA